MIIREYKAPNKPVSSSVVPKMYASMIMAAKENNQLYSWKYQYSDLLALPEKSAYCLKHFLK